MGTGATLENGKGHRTPICPTPPPAHVMIAGHARTNAASQSLQTPDWCHKGIPSSCRHRPRPGRGGMDGFSQISPSDTPGRSSPHQGPCHHGDRYARAPAKTHPRRTRLARTTCLHRDLTLLVWRTRGETGGAPGFAAPLTLLGDDTSLLVRGTAIPASAPVRVDVSLRHEAWLYQKASAPSRVRGMFSTEHHAVIPLPQ